jgi:hypothetical protein
VGEPLLGQPRACAFEEVLYEQRCAVASADVGLGRRTLELVAGAVGAGRHQEGRVSSG